MDVSGKYYKSNPNFLEPDTRMLETLQSETFADFTQNLNPENGLIADKSQPGSHSSIAAVGLGITAYIVAIGRNFISREEGNSVTS